MVQYVDIVNRALGSCIGTRSNLAASDLANNTCNEAIQANLILYEFRDRLIRLAPWDCSTQTTLLTYICSTPGTPENQSSPSTQNWQPGMPQPPWTYEYQYPANCLRALRMVPQASLATVGAIPISPVTTGFVPIFPQPPIKYEAVTDFFYSIASVTIANGGTGYAVGDYITLAGANSITNPATQFPPLGAPAVLQVTAVSAGVITAASVVSVVADESTPVGGSYFYMPSSPLAQGSTTGSGFGATFTPTWNSQGDQRVLCTNAENAVLTMCKKVTDPNVFDPMFRGAYEMVLAAGLVRSLTGDKALANALIAQANQQIADARAVDGNEGLTINDVTPDFLRVRGVVYNDYWYLGMGGFEFGAFWPTYI